MIIEISNLKEIDDLMAGDQMILIDFYATWCPPCRQLTPIFNKVSTLPEFKDISFIKINVDAFSDIGGKYHVSSLPTLVCWKSKEIGRTTGLLQENQLINFLRQTFFCS